MSQTSAHGRDVRGQDAPVGTSIGTGGPTEQQRHPDGGARSALETVGENALRLLGGLTRSPSAPRIETNGVSVHRGQRVSVRLEWPAATVAAPY
ncbi:hypothetical protein [Streptomyces luteolus]|uniref:Uncharacterized protein n=1 Tax=Streptomyces luteolus TaxID=3043615 RepID=A0ABT6T437_9ACTN|nr:hypothetical protein [Streptomyces sp. B-S-A12]MDI3422627.1 hypothetical protein [Streptomyces sp. B-S-A12]